MSRKTVTVEVDKADVFALLQAARTSLGHRLVEYDERGEVFRFMIDGAKADVVRWQAVLDTFD
jgi:hypothetical protein